MEVKVTKTIEKSLNNSNNKRLLQDIQLGSDDFTETSGYDEATDLENNFDVKDVFEMTIDLKNGNTFDQDILALVPAAFGDISFIHVSCVETDIKKVPVRFNVVLNDGTNDMDLGDMAELSLTNLKGNLIQQVTISQVVIAPTYNAQLQILVGSKNKNGA
jgi:hypothetical protein